MIEALLLIMDMLECERSKPRIVKLKEGMLVNGKYSSVNLITQKKREEEAENRIGQGSKERIEFKNDFMWLQAAGSDSSSNPPPNSKANRPLQHDAR